MAYLLNLVYLALIALASPWLVYRALAHGKYIDGWRAKWLGLVPRREGDRPCVWFHAVSVGEVNLLEPLIVQLAKQQPSWEIVVSTTTRTGHALAQTRYPHLSVFYCPLDFSWSTRAAMRRIRPALLVLAELELWPNLIDSASRRGVRVAVVNGRLSQRSFHGYRRITPLVRRLLRQIDLLAVQNEAYAVRFRALGAAADRVCVTGSLKFDGAQTDRNNPKTTQLRSLAGIAATDRILLAGSTQDPEEQIVVETYEALRPTHPDLRLILVPRHPERFETVARLLQHRGLAFIRRSELDRQPPRPEVRVLLVDTIGELGAWWGVADVAFVGGSLGNRGGQNMIEPAAYGAAVCFGPNTKHFREIVEALLARQAAEVVHDGAELTAFVRRCLTDPPYAATLGEQARRLVESQLGATPRTLERLMTLVDREAVSKRRAA